MTDDHPGPIQRSPAAQMAVAYARVILGFLLFGGIMLAAEVVL